MILQRIKSGYLDSQGNKYSLIEAQRMLEIANDVEVNIIVRNNVVRERIKHAHVSYIDDLLGYIARPKEGTIQNNINTLIDKGWVEESAIEYIKAVYKSKLQITI